GGQYFTPKSIVSLIVEMLEPYSGRVYDPAMGFRVIIMTQANSQVNTRVLELLPKFKIKKMNRWCTV
ncbi:TPA: N-6 DNA methylase, partial [Haemophilus influenzae]